MNLLRLIARWMGVVALFVVPLCLPFSAAAQDRTEGAYERAEVLRVESQTQQVNSSTTQQVRAYHVRFLSGGLRGQEHTIFDDVGTNPYQIRPEVGSKIVVSLQPGEADQQWNFYIESFDRRAALIALVVVFVLMLVLLAGWQGVKVAASIGISLLLIAYVLIPAFLAGWNPVPVAILLGGVFTLLSCGLGTGWNKKAVITAVGTMGGALVAYLLAVVFADLTHLSGLSTEEDRLFFQKNPGLDPRGLLFAGIIIAAAGVLEDVAVSIVSGISEVHRANPKLGFQRLFLSGMAVGRDHMAALANTLVYAYVGASLSTLLLYKQFGESWMKFMNFDSVVDEIIRSLCGTIGLIFTVPITALLAAWILTHTSIDHESPTVSHSHRHSL